jgi:hypothetical protein
MSELGDTLKALRARLDEFAANVDVETKRATVTQLEGRMSDQIGRASCRERV